MNIELHRNAIIQTLTGMILGIYPRHPLRVAIDGVDAAGKTTLAEELALSIQSQPRQVIRASVDGFHQPKAIRRQAGDLSPEGFYRDSYHYTALIENLLAPLGPDGDCRYRTAVFDVRTDRPIDSPVQTAAADAILLMDGIFLLRPVLLPWWDLTIFLQVDFETTALRGIDRDSLIFGSREEAQQRYGERYIPGQKLYLDEARPMDKADIVLDNNDLSHQRFIRKPPMDSINTRLPRI